mmetsp:Transcript_18328/g.62276  ORF Transcript_18328/g.62276 Transcript_18328/m.62276 type:complete len:287 (+) Transcript_18328:2776-3636(+)
MKERYDFGVTYTWRRKRSKYSVQAAVTLLCTWPMCSWSDVLTSSLHAIWKSPMNFVDTATSASTGHGRNQSMVQPLMRPGNWLARRLKVEPTGEKHRHTCRLSRTRPRKKSYRLSYVSATVGASFFITGRMSFTIMSISSLGNRPATSPVMRIWLMNSRKPSSFTSASVKMNATFWPLNPAILYIPLMSSNRFVWLYVLVTTIWKVREQPEMYAASLARLCLPEPPTPTSSAEPRSMQNRRPMRIRWYMASVKSTRSSLSALLVWLNRSCFSLTMLRRSSRFLHAS